MIDSLVPLHGGDAPWTMCSVVNAASTMCWRLAWSRQQWECWDKITTL